MINPVKCVIILGGGITKTKELPEWSKQRCDEAITYYFYNYKNYDIKFIVTSGGTYHYPNPVDSNGFTIFECSLMAEYLVKKGICKMNIFREYTSYDTIGNAFFIKTIFTDIRKWYDLIIITSNFHMGRSIEIFNFLFKKLDSKYLIQFITTKDMLNNSIIEDRIKRETNGKKKFIEDMKNINDLTQFHKWLFDNHNCYKSIQPKREILNKYLLYY